MEEGFKGSSLFSSSTIMAAMHTLFSSPMWTWTDFHSLLEKKKQNKIKDSQARHGKALGSFPTKRQAVVVKTKGMPPLFNCRCCQTRGCFSRGISHQRREVTREPFTPAALLGIEHIKVGWAFTPRELWWVFFFFFSFSPQSRPTYRCTSAPRWSVADLESGMTKHIFVSRRVFGLTLMVVGCEAVSHHLTV